MFKWMIQFKNMIDLVREHHHQEHCSCSVHHRCLCEHIIIDRITNIPRICPRWDVHSSQSIHFIAIFFLLLITLNLLSHTHPSTHPLSPFAIQWQASIVPFYVQLAAPNGNQTGFLRVLRLFRIIKILRMLRLLSVLKNVDVAAQIIWATLSQGSLILSVFIFFVIIFVLFFGCIIYLAEQGDNLLLLAFFLLSSVDVHWTTSLTEPH